MIRKGLELLDVLCGTESSRRQQSSYMLERTSH